MSDLQWKIEDGELLVWRKCGTTTSAEGTKPFFAWIEPRPKEVAAILLADRAATQEKCAQVADAEERDAADAEAADDARGYSANVHVARGRMKAAETIASAIRALKMETGE